MTLAEIKAAVNGRDTLGQWLIICDSNESCIGLTWQDGVTVNGKPDEFFIGAVR